MRGFRPLFLGLSSLLLLALPTCGKEKHENESESCASPDETDASAGQACAVDQQCPAFGTQPGQCVLGICGVLPSTQSCDDANDRKGCPSGFRCRTMEVEQGCFATCQPTCDCAASCGGQCDEVCMPRDGQNCDPRGCSISRGPALACKVPPASLGNGPWFSDVTNEVNLGDGPGGEDAVGVVFSAIDIDEDGFDDLFVHQLSAERDDDGVQKSERRRRVFLNRPGNDGKRVFVDHTMASGYALARDGHQGRVSTFAIFADVDNDGHIDIFSGTQLSVAPSATDPGDRSEFFFGNGDGTFRMGELASLYTEERQASSGATFIDYDLDGLVDLFVVNDYGWYGYMNTAQQDRMYRNLGDGIFEDITHGLGFTTLRGTGFEQGLNTRPSWGVTACDVDGDGDQDLLVSVYGLGWNMLWENQQGKRFENIAKRTFYDADDNLDYSDNEIFRCHCDLNPGAPECIPDPGPARIVCSSDSWRVGVDDQPWRLAGTTGTSVCGDIDNDGDLDVFNAEIHHWHHGQASDRSQLLLNDGKGTSFSFQRPGNEAMGLGRTWDRVDFNEGDISAAFLDFDNDGLQDILIGCSDYPGTHDFLFRQKPDHTFEDVTEVSGAGHYYGQQVLAFDFDRDGDLDIVVGSSTMRCSSDPKCPWAKQEVHLYRNDVGHLSNWMGIRLVGAGVGASNASAVGARIVVKVGDVSQTRTVQAGYGHYGIQAGLTQYIGLGDVCVADLVEIHWPSRDRTVTRLQYVPANYFVTVVEADGSVRYEEPGMVSSEK